MPATRNVQIRLDSAVFERYSDIAQAREMPLAAYLRLILEEGMVGHGEAMEALLGEMTALREALQSQAGPEAGMAGIMLELLILARAKASMPDKQMAQGELKRQGLSPWSGRAADIYDEPAAPISPTPASPAPAAPGRRGLFGKR